LVAGTTTTGSATGWAWSFIGTLGANAIIDSGTNGSQVIRVKFTSSAAAVAGDSVRVCYTSGCGNSPWKSAKLTNATLAAPTTPASVTITAISTNVCGNKIYRYTAPALTGTATGWQWSFVGTLGTNATLDSGTLNSRIVRMKFTNNAAAGTGDSARVMYTSTCGNSPNKSLKLTNTLLSAPASPTAITTTALITNVCGGRVYRYAAPVLPAATTTAGAATGYIWSFTGPLHYSATGAQNFIIDSGTINSRIIRIKYTSNAAASTTDSVRVCYTSGCGNSPNKSSKLTFTALNAPAAPATLTQTLVSNVCGSRVYRFSTSALVAATTSAGAATGWQWSFVGNLGLNATVDSGTLNSQVVRMKFTLNSAAATGDSARVAYISGCGTGTRKTAKLSNLAFLCVARSIVNSTTENSNDQTVEVYPNPSSNEFNIQTGYQSHQLIQYRLTDLNGKLLQQGQLSTGTTQHIGAQLKPGVYFIEFIQNGRRTIRKLVKQ
jgi:hypothetical protein